MMKVFVTGVAGQLGYDVINELNNRDFDVVGSDIKENFENNSNNIEYVVLDITDKEKVFEVINKIKPNIIIHCAAWTAVDLAEDEDKKELVYSINVKGTENIAKACKSLDIPMMYISTDYVFDKKDNNPIKPDDQEFSPLNYYGETKLLGEKSITSLLDKFFIVRIAWVFGSNGSNFIKTMLKIGKNHNEVRVVNDQIGTPTYTYDLARLLVDMISTNKYGYYNVTNEGDYISWYDYCVEIYKQAGLTTIVYPVTSAEYGASKARRPFNSRLDKSKLTLNGFKPLPDWKDALNRYLKEIGELK